ncbi:hypothetical protein Bca101_060064 [Brassica carinata]
MGYGVAVGYKGRSEAKNKMKRYLSAYQRIIFDLSETKVILHEAHQVSHDSTGKTIPFLKIDGRLSLALFLFWMKKREINQAWGTIYKTAERRDCLRSGRSTWEISSENELFARFKTLSLAKLKGKKGGMSLSLEFIVRNINNLKIFNS